MPKQPTVPKHVGVIMDGNRRWAAEHSVATAAGHKAGFEALFALLPTIRQLNIPYVSIYAFSAENWLRSAAEVRGIMRLVEWVVSNKLAALQKQGVRVRIIGSREGLSKKVLQALERAEAETAEGVELTLGICFNYGGQQEIIDAAKHLLASGTAVEQLTPEVFAQHLYQPDIPTIDLLIRTSGEQRLSNFMLWRSAYAELYFTDVLWPDFSAADMKAALQTYADRQRRFGG